MSKSCNYICKLIKDQDNTDASSISGGGGHGDSGDAFTEGGVGWGYNIQRQPNMSRVRAMYPGPP